MKNETEQNGAKSEYVRTIRGPLVAASFTAANLEAYTKCLNRLLMKKARFENKTNLSGVGCPVKFKFSVLDVNFFAQEIWQGFRMPRVS